MNDPLEIRKDCGFLHELNSSAVRSNAAPYDSRNHARGSMHNAGAEQLLISRG